MTSRFTLPSLVTQPTHNRASAQKGRARVRIVSTIIAAVAVSSTLAACGGGAGGGTAIPKQSNPFLEAPTAPMMFSVRIPANAATSSNARRPSYVSSNTNSVSFTITSWNGNAETASPVIVSLSGANCTGSGSSKVCTVTSSAPIGSDVWKVATYASGNGTGTALSENSASGTITAAGPNNLSVTLNPVVASLAFSPVNASCLDGTPCNGSVIIQALDASGAVIIGPGSYLTPALAPDTISESCGSPHLTLTRADGQGPNNTFSDPTQNNVAKAYYDGTSLGASGGTLTCSVSDSGGASATFTLTTSSTGSASWTLN